ncbi:MAG: hypothetical protein ABI186_00735 [Candidatus Elarobacter sp.]
MTHDGPERGLPSGDVSEITWGKKGSSAIQIPAHDVTAPGTWYAAYSWDGDDKKLTLTKPTQQKPPAQPSPAHKAADSVDIKAITIETWGTSKLETPLEWSGETSGVASIVFSAFPDISGPIGKVTG